MQKKGRNKELIEKRNIRLCERYHYWTETQRLRFDDTIKILAEEEFFISEETVLRIISKYSKKLKELQDNPELIINPVPKVKVPRLTAKQLALLQASAT